MTNDELERRLRLLEDRLAILDLLAAYGPAADSAEASQVVDLWTQDAVYDTDPKPLNGRDELVEMIGGDLHQSFVGRGCAHVQASPHITIDGDRAVARFHSLLLLYEPEAGSFRVLRASANRCELVRLGGRWLIHSRVNRVLDGSPTARALFVQ